MQFDQLLAKLLNFSSGVKPCSYTSFYSNEKCKGLCHWLMRLPFETTNTIQANIYVCHQNYNQTLIASSHVSLNKTFDAACDALTKENK